MRRRLRPNWVELEGASVPIFLLVSNRPPDFAGPWTVHLDFVTDALEVAVHQAQAAGAVFRGANLLGNGPDVLRTIDRVGSDMGWSVGTCGKDGQGAPVSDGLPTLRIPKGVVIGGIAG